MRNFLGLTLVVVITLGHQIAGASECPALQDSATVARELLE